MRKDGKTYKQTREELIEELMKFRSFKKDQRDARMAYAKEHCRFSFKEFNNRWDFGWDEFVEEGWEDEAIFELRHGKMKYYLMSEK